MHHSLNPLCLKHIIERLYLLSYKMLRERECYKQTEGAESDLEVRLLEEGGWQDTLYNSI